MRNICKDRKEFFRTVLESLRGTCSEYCKEYGDFDAIPRSEWEHVLYEYLFYVLDENISDTDKNVDVDFENVGEGGAFTNGGLNGLQKLSTGELFYCFDCCGDWEAPVNAIIYVEDGKVKFHVPERGNNFNVEQMCAYGSEDFDEDSDSEEDDDFDEEDDDDFDEEDDMIDEEEELKEIEEFLRKSDGIADIPNELGNLPKELESVKRQPENILGARKEAFSSADANLCYCVTTSVWCIRQGRNGKPSTMCANSSSSYPNAFKTYDEAVDYVHMMMMVNHDDKLHNWDKFLERISIVEGSDVVPDHGIGYVHHPMADGVERFEGFDASGSYPCLIDDFIITKRSVKALENNYSDDSVTQSPMKIEPMQANHYIKGEKMSEFTPHEQEEHQKDMDRIVGEMGGIESMFAGDQNGEFDKMKDILGWNEDGDGK